MSFLEQPALIAVADVPDLSGGALLGEVEAVLVRRRQCDVDLVMLVQEFARQHDGGGVDPVRASLPGRERAVRLGGDGTPQVAEFAPAVLAARMQLSPYAGRSLVADVLDLAHRLPILNARLIDGEVALGHARFVAAKTRHLGQEDAAKVDAAVAEVADGRLAWSRFETAVDAAIIAADPEMAEEAEERARRDQFARITGGATRSDEHGLRGFYIKADAATIARFDATVAFLANCLLVLGDGRGLDARRVAACLLLANPMAAVRVLRAFRDTMAKVDVEQRTREEAGAHTDAEGREHSDVVDPERFDPSGRLPDIEGLDWSKLLPTIWMFVHLAQTDDGGAAPVARVEGLHPVTTDWVRDVLGPHMTFKITPVLDPLGQTPVDSYEIPVRHRNAVHAMTPADVFPFAGSVDRNALQIDHTTPFVPPDEGGPPGQSAIGNYGPMTGLHHRIKTHGHWTVRQPYPGVYLWRDPYGAFYLVDHTGTRRLLLRSDVTQAS